MPRAAVLVACAVAATAVIVGGGVLTLGTSDTPAPTATTDAADPAPFRTTPLASYDTSGAVVSRGPFCDAVDARQVSAALGGDPASSSSWQNGDRIDLGNGVKDVGHEFGCRYAGADGTVAEAWVFAPPVDAQEGQQLIKSAGQARGCAAGAGPPLGSPTLALTCAAKDGTVRASYRGLFGDAWVVCEVDRPPGATWDAADRAGRWCVGVLGAAKA